MDGRMPFATLAMMIAGAVGGLALGAFATGPAYSNPGPDRSPRADRTADLATSRYPEPVVPAPPVRMARYGGRLVVCTGCANPVWQPQAAAPVRYSGPDGDARYSPAPNAEPSAEMEGPVPEPHSVTVFVGSRPEPLT